MPELPPHFHEDFPKKGETFYTIAEIVLFHHGRQLTAEEVAAQVDPGKEGVQQHLRELEEKGWIDGFDGPKSYTWNTQGYNPAKHDAQDAVGTFSDEILSLGSRALRSPTETLAFAAVMGVVIAAVLAVTALLATFLPVDPETPQTYAFIGSGFAVGSILTLGLIAIKTRLGSRDLLRNFE
jgi:hypothetical protein